MIFTKPEYPKVLKLEETIFIWEQNETGGHDLIWKDNANWMFELLTKLYGTPPPGFWEIERS